MKTLIFLRSSIVSACLLYCGAVFGQGVAVSDNVDQSIERGLTYLANVQYPNGAFPQNHGEAGSISALAGMAWLAKGYTPGSGKYGENINRSIDYILSLATKDGFLGEKEPGNGKMYCHSICTLFLSEISGMVDEMRQKRIDAVLPLAVKILLDAQNVRKSERDKGGWRYQRNSSDSDMSCTGWALMALRSSRLNGGRVPSDAIDRAVAYVRRQHNEGEGSFVYQLGGESYAVTLTGAGILCLELCGKHNDPYSRRAVNYLMRAYPELLHQGNRSYGMYYTAQGLFQLGGDGWKVFEDWMYRVWIPRQRADGSWVEEERSAPYNTALLVLAFTVPYRQLPIYQRDETVDED